MHSVSKWFQDRRSLLVVGFWVWLLMLLLLGKTTSDCLICIAIATMYYIGQLVIDEQRRLHEKLMDKIEQPEKPCKEFYPYGI